MGSAVKSTLKFSEATHRFRKAGIPARALLPIAPVDARISDVGHLTEDVLGKAPGRYNPRKGDWRGLGGAYVQSGVPKRELEGMQDWPTPNVGVLGRWAPAIDSDAENDDARRLVESVLIEVFGREAGVAERVRGDSPRRLYAFRCRAPEDPAALVRTRHLSYRLPGEDERDPLHKLDVIGAGAQYLIAGTHPSGAPYGWVESYALADMVAADTLERVDDADILRFLDAFREELARIGGTLISSRGGGAPGEEHDYSGENPVLPVRDILNGLDCIPNTEENFPTRDDFVSILSAIRAALGREADQEREAVEAWATEDPDWCSAEYFDKVWDSLNRGVRVDRNALDRVFRRNGVFASARAEFPDDARAITANVRERKAEGAAEVADVLARAASAFVFGAVNTRTDDGTLRIRRAWDPFEENNAERWWKFETTDEDVDLLLDIQGCDRYGAKPAGLWKFARDLRKRHPGCFYQGETRDPRFGCGEIVTETLPNGSKRREINLRFQSPVQLHAKKPAADARQAREDLELVLDFVNRVFGEMRHYELDTLAYMAQTGSRPGHMLFLVGEPGVGKSIYSQMLISMFDGVGRDMGGQIDGTKMMNEAARRFALAKVEGCRIISVKELPEGSTAHNMAQVTASLKQIVDAGPDGDFFQIEAKGKDSRSVRNFARVIATSNYQNSIQVEESDRRIFFVRCCIDPENKPGPDFYADLTDVTGNPERLAAFWRHLLTRDISQYQVAKAPPVTREKEEAMLASMDALDRHMYAAVKTMQRAERCIFDTRELADLMTAMSENENENTNGTVDDRKVYDFGDMPAAAKRVTKYALKLDKVRSNGGPRSSVYGLRTARREVERLASVTGTALLDELEQDRACHPLSREHTFPLFSGPWKPRNRKR